MDKFKILNYAYAILIATITYLPSAICQERSHSDDRFLTSNKFLFIDSRNVAHTESVKLVFGSPIKSPSNPLFGPDKPWEQNFDNFCGNIMYDDDFKKYRLWYSNMLDGVNCLLYAESEDGIRWMKPSLHQVEYKGSKENNIVMLNAHGVGVFKDTHESDSLKKYKMISKHDEKDEWVQVAFSRDGIYWSKHIPEKQISATADTHNNAFWAPTLKKYVAITRQFSRWPYNDQTKGDKESKHEYIRKGVRQVARSESDDFLNWTRAEVILEGVDPRRQTYAMPAFYYEGIYLGLVGVLERGESERVFTELVWSPDTYNWYVINPGDSFIPKSWQSGDYDYGMLWACARPIIRGDSILLYYAGFDLPHGAKGRKGHLALATLRKDGWAGYKAENDNGFVKTTPKRLSGSEVRITADVANGGYIKARLYDEKGTLIATSEVVKHGGTDYKLSWPKHAISSLQEKEVSLEFEFTKAMVFSYEFTDPK